MNTHQFPHESQQIYDKLIAPHDSDLIESDVKAAFKAIAKGLAGKTLVAHGVNLSWELAVHEIANRAGGAVMLSWMMDNLFDDSMRSLLPVDFASEVIAVRETLRSMRKG